MDEQQRRSLESAPLQRLIAIAGHITAQRWTRVTSAQHGLSSAGASALLVLRFGIGGSLGDGVPGRATSGELARRLWIRPASMTGIIDNLERDGLVERSRDEADRRQVWISLTPAGAKRVWKLSEELREALPGTQTEQDSEKAAIVRQYLIELIELYDETKEGDDGESTDQQTQRAGERSAAGRSGS
jgi:DNA-binding MarR family transcriptional regulator